MAILPVLSMTTGFSQQVNQIQLERVYRDWVGAMNTGNFSQWQKLTASHRRAHTHNMVISRRGQWPDAVFRLPFKLPEIATLSHLATLQSDHAANLVYFGRIDFGLEGRMPPDNLIMLRFFKEEDGWKFDSTSFFNLSEEPEVRRMAMLGDTTFLDDPQFQPPESLPEVPRRVRPPDYVGDLWVASLGYETTIRIGDLHETVVANEEVTTAVLGGLSRSGIPITVTTKQIDFPPDGKRYLGVEIYALRPGKKAAKVWSYQPELAAEIPEHKSKVWANAVTIPGG